MSIEDQLNRAHEEQLAAHSRENEPAGICECCTTAPEDCDRDAAVCMTELAEDYGEREFEARRGMYD